MVSNLESFICLWLDQTVNTYESNKKTQKEIRQIINDLRTFDHSGQCEECIRQIKEEKVVLIVSGGLGRQIVPRIHDLPQISVCYVFCQDAQANKPWASKYPKINGVFIHSDALLRQITEDQINRTKTEDGSSITVMSSGSQHLQARNALFMWFQLFIEILLHMRHKSSDRKELIDVCRKSYAGNDQQMLIIDEFEKDYNPENAISWYTRDSCFYRMMNKALRVQDFDMLFSFRSFITDIAKQMQCGYEDFIRTNGSRNVIRVYRGQVITVEELELMQNNIGEFLSMNSFLSTSRDRFVAMNFAQLSQKRGNMRPIVFEIEIDPRLRTKAFVDTSQTSYFQDESEVLIMLGALFRIDKVFEDDGEQSWIARMSLASEDDYHLKEMFTHMKEKIGNDTNFDSLGKLLLRMGENEKARKCYKRMLDETQLTVGDAHLGLGWASLRCNACDESLQHFQESLEIRQRILGANHASVGECYGFLGEVYRKKNENEKALSYLTKAMIIQEKTLPKDSLDLAAIYDTMANTYIAIRKYDIALGYYNKVLEIRQAKLPSDHPQLAAIYNNIGSLHECEEDYTKALDCYRKALDIGRKTLPPTHNHVVSAEKNIRRLKDKMHH